MFEPVTSELPAVGKAAKTRPSRGNTAWNRHVDRLRARLREHPLPGIDQQEVDAHFRRMPGQYWQRVTKSELIWGLETIHGFLQKSSAASFPGSVVLADSRHCPERGFSKVMVCVRDRPGLLAKIAAALSALRVNILRADVYTRSDNLALDLFEVCELERSNGDAARRLQDLVFLLEGALSEPPRFASIWASQFHKVLGRPKVVPMPRVDFDNDYSVEYTVVRVIASDRLGLLHDLLQSLTDCGVNINQAIVETDNYLASDVFYVTDLKRDKILNPLRLEEIRKHLINAVNF